MQFSAWLHDDLLVMLYPCVIHIVIDIRLKKEFNQLFYSAGKSKKLLSPHRMQFYIRLHGNLLLLLDPCVAHIVTDSRLKNRKKQLFIC